MHERNDSLADLKASFDLRDVIAETQRVGADHKTLCPFHADSKPSLHCYADHYHCYACGERGDVLDWFEHVYGTDLAGAATEARRRLGLDDGAGGSPRPVVRAAAPAPKREEEPTVPPWLPAFVRAARASFQRGESAPARTARAYVEARGLSSVAERLGFGVADQEALSAAPDAWRFHGRLIVPTVLDREPIWFKARYVGRLTDEERDEQGIARYDSPRGRIAAPFGAVDLARAAEGGGVVVLTEGELDAASLLAAGVTLPVLGLSGGTMPAGWYERIARSGVAVVILRDADERGREKAAKHEATLEALGVRCVVADPPRGALDTNEALVQHGPTVLRGHVETLVEAVRASRDQAVADQAEHEAADRAAQEAEEASRLAEARAKARALRSGRQYLTVVRREELRRLREQPYTRFETGLPALDTVLGGGFAEGVHVIGGLTGTGKTSLAMSIALHNAGARRPVIYATYEQSRFELWGRAVASVTGITQRQQKTGWVLGDLGAIGDDAVPVEEALEAHPEWPRLVEASDHLNIVEAGDALSGTRGAWDLAGLDAQVKAIVEADGAPPMLIVDYLQRVPAPQEIREIRERVAHVAGRLQILARTYHMPVLLLSSLNRASYRAGALDQEAKLASLKEAGEVEYTAHTVVLVYKPTADDLARLGPPPALARPMAIEVIKQRDGELGTIAALWDPARDRWTHSKPWPAAA